MQSVKWLFFFAGTLILSLSLRKPDAPVGTGTTHHLPAVNTELNTELNIGLNTELKQLVSDDPASLNKTDESAIGKVNWLTLKQAEDSLRINPKPILIDLYTEWCGWCKVMDKKTYANKNVTEYLQRKFYAVKLDAETRKEINWKGKKYLFNAGYRTNDFSVYLTNGQLSYPTTVFIPSDNGDPQAIPGYLEPKDFELIVKFFGEGKFGKVPFEDYRKSFKATW